MTQVYPCLTSSPSTTIVKEKPSFSIVLLSTGSESQLESALAYLAGATRRFDAEVIVVRPAGEGVADDRVRTLTESREVTLCFAPASATRSVMAELGMQAVTGDIVALREDRACLEPDWLRPFARQFGATVEHDASVEVATIARAPRVSPIAPRRRQVSSGAVS